ncbi:phage putative head morphogenesis protein, SPP1 gp7 family [Desulfonauticus submarinus]|uniref:Phage putative head morphogenesis protein, SPP1 gp7 family n=1 Tax=Desulfonauticus submarinus TaxID=206665 RepID=A0A1H0GAE7_9BACT|nr:phage minor head protein [Desulfonauticus submarinus]SDO03749.1 phage putative head morphogenesis protein, SPP1 gp7 family [Desulfonauticus submarinus]
MGKIQRKKKLEFAEITLEPLPPEEALNFWKDKILLTPFEFYQLDEEKRVHAFTAAKLYTADELNAVHKALQKALDEGITLKQFKKQIQDIITSPWHTEVVFRTNIQTSYQVGRYRQMMKVKQRFPLWMYDAVNDSRTRPTHAMMDEKIYPADHPFWSRWYPPNGYNCRCSVIPLRDDVPPNRISKDMPPQEPDPGFGTNPAKDYFGSLENIFQDKIKKYPKKFADNLRKTLQDEFGKIKSVQDIDKVIKTKLADEFKNGYSGTVAVNEKYFMATDPSNGGLFISSKKFPRLNNFSPLNDLMNAFNKLGKEKLSFNEEYALEALWHEIVHNKQIFAGRYEKSVVETVTQWYARRTYPNLLKKLGNFTPEHQERIIKEGYGYSNMVSRLDELLTNINIKDKDVLLDIEEMIHSTSIDLYPEKLAEILAEKTNGNKTGILNLIYLHLLL